MAAATILMLGASRQGPSRLAQLPGLGPHGQPPPLVVESRLTLANDYGEREAAQQMVAALAEEHPRAIGADKGYDAKGLMVFLRWWGATLHVRHNIHRLGNL
ncbi:MAG: hypothetical protein TE42_09805 [Candidatus Synechococcus spongiarum SP3]|uniref:Uncharacterized protein n=1 Tax=Candidatus Synechococcus spongiarum SP3 TaxID=1604020 RepID=A0A0G2HK59_9SYNE|nr:MAG: hypothetical protein TE42_09805 [Candidatus Synechococcus spongiarum SP3]